MSSRPKESWSSLQARMERIRRSKGKGESPPARAVDGLESAKSTMMPPVEGTPSGGQGEPADQHIPEADPGFHGSPGNPGVQQGPLRLDSVRIATQPRWRHYLKTIGWGLIKALGFSLLFGDSVRCTIRPMLIEGGQVISGYWCFALFFLLDALLKCVTEVSFSRPGIDWWRPGRLETTPDGVELVIDGAPLRLSRAEILSGWTTAPNGTILVLQTKRQAVTVELPDKETTSALMRELGVAAGQRVFSAPLNRSPRPNRFDAWGTLLILGLYALALPASARLEVSYFAVLFPLLPLALMLFGVVSVFRRLFRLLTSRVSVGVDGLTIAQLGKREFVTFGQIGRIYSTHTTPSTFAWMRPGAKAQRIVHVELRDQRRFVLQGPNDEATMALHAHLKAGFEASIGQAPSAFDLRALERKGRGVREWLGSVKAAVARAGDYRHDWLDGRDLPAMVTDARADTEQRIAAAAALSTRADPEVHGRLRIALQASANEPVRVAIEKALDGELEAAEIEHALEAEKKTLTT